LSSEAIRVTSTVRGDDLHVDLANPNRRNAIDEVFTDGLIRALESIESVRAVLLASRGADFCMEGDGNRSELDRPTTPRPMRSAQRRLRRKGP
jgi:enoyl-CoA hydratase/carnithine racemase